MQTESVARAINRQQWLKPVEDGLKKGLDQAFAADTERGKPIENALHGVWLGHALHPVLTDIPLGAWTVAFALDLAETCGARRYGPGADARALIVETSQTEKHVPDQTLNFRSGD